ncbi:hypothetical protein ACFWA6_13850 [Streptomyces sp. NPDC060020]|uniref:hypothetical protein n=1 Tax=Streptomyces sp. NPDC060020 TaxID=3347038 RepID=UPI0036B0AC76
MPFPTWSAGQRVTAALLTAMQPVTVVKSANTTRASTTTLASDPHLVLPVTAGATYLLDGFLEYDGNFGGTGDLKLDWTLPAGATIRWAALGNASGDTTQKYASTSAAAGTTLSVGTYGVAGAGGVRNAASPRGYLTVAGTAGNITLRWAQQSSHATGTTLYAGSWIRLLRQS